jgi:hypothetical protein
VKVVESYTTFESLVEPEKLQDGRGVATIKADDLTRTIKEQLIENGFKRKVIKGGYQGETTSWYVSFWEFIAF